MFIMVSYAANVSYWIFWGTFTMHLEKYMWTILHTSASGWMFTKKPTHWSFAVECLVHWASTRLSVDSQCPSDGVRDMEVASLLWTSTCFSAIIHTIRSRLIVGRVSGMKVHNEWWECRYNCSNLLHLTNAATSMLQTEETAIKLLLNMASKILSRLLLPLSTLEAIHWRCSLCESENRKQPF